MAPMIKSLLQRAWIVLTLVGLVHLVLYSAAANQPLRQLRTKLSTSPVRHHRLRRSLEQDCQQHSSALTSVSASVGVAFVNESVAVDPASACDALQLEWSTTGHGGHGNSTDPPPAESASLIDYLGFYESASSSMKPLVLGVMILWLMFLFAFVGITAADFFCPNLSTIATRLGMSESVAGCTLLAFSNGSPDVFSTFSALQAHSGSLAIGELIGAASFITMVVSGTMCLIHPFRVPSHTFLRDVGFFAIAVAFTLVILWDSHIHAWEATAMVLLYIAYVIFVAGGSWWVARRERRRERIRQARSEYAADTTEYRDDSSPASQSAWQQSLPTPTVAEDQLNDFHFPSHPHQHEVLTEESLLNLTATDTPVTLTRTRSGSSATPRSPLFRRPHSQSTVRPSLLGAIEFRDVVNSLRADSTARTLAVFGGEDGHTHANALSAGAGNGGEATSSTPIDQRSRRGPHMHGRSASSGSGLGGSMARMMSPSVGSAVDGGWNGSRGISGLSSMTDGAAVSPRTGSADRLEDGRPWEDEGSTDREREGDGSVITPPLVDAVNPWRGANSEGSGASPATIGRRDSPTLSRSSLTRLEIPSFPFPKPSTPRTPAVTKVKRVDPATMLDASGQVIRRRPSILLTSAAGDESTVLGPAVAPTSLYDIINPSGFLHIARAVFLALFPSLHEWKNKSIVGKATALLCVPAILLLNLTLPVVECEDDSCDEVEEKERREHDALPGYRDLEEGEIEADDDEEDEDNIRSLGDVPYRAPDTLIKDAADRKARFQRNAVSHHFASAASPWIESDHHHPPHPYPSSQLSDYGSLGNSGLGVEVEGVGGKDDESSVEDVEIDEVDGEVLTRYLTAVQCTLAPVFCVCALFGTDTVYWYPLAALAGGLVLASLAFWTFKRHNHPGRIVLCFVGFFVAMVWILTIVNEVVGVLQTIAVVFGLSDAIIGLTVFAMGNSVGDWVANATVARMGFPNMAISACFAGPMLNILLGLGLSGSYIIYKNGGHPYHVEVGRTLMVSGVSLLLVLIATLILVPMNGYWMNRKLGAGLIAAYSVVLSINIAVEVWK